MTQPTASRPVEVTTRYATTTETLPEAWAFVMEHLDSVGTDPTIHVSPVWDLVDAGVAATIDDVAPGRFDALDGDGARRRFEVVVEGMVEQRA
jgi:hypothetical protein